MSDHAPAPVSARVPLSEAPAVPTPSGEFVRCEYCGLHYHRNDINGHRIADHNEPAPAAPTPSEPRPVIAATEDHPAIYRDGHRLTATAPAVPLTSGSEGEARIAEISSRLEAWRAFRASLTEENVCDEPQSFAELALEAHAGSDIAYLLTALASARSALDAIAKKLEVKPDEVLDEVDGLLTVASDRKAVIVNLEAALDAKDAELAEAKAWLHESRNRVWSMHASECKTRIGKECSCGYDAARSAVSRDTPGKWLDGSAVRDVVENVNAYDRLDPAARAVSRGEADA